MTNRSSWWRHASAEDIARAWRASTAWAAVDPRAREAQRIIVDRLAKRGVRVNPQAPSRPGDGAWLSDELDRAAVHGAGAESHTEARTRTAQQRQEKMAVYVRDAWSADRAERVIGSAAWPALAYKLDQLQRVGHDVPDLLQRVPGFVDRAHTPAAYAFRVVDDYATDVDQAAEDRAAAGGQRAEERTAATLEGEWQEATTTSLRIAEMRASDTRTGADHASTRAGDLRAEHLAAKAFPQSTKTAVAVTTTEPAAGKQRPSATWTKRQQPTKERRLARDEQAGRDG